MILVETSVWINALKMPASTEHQEVDRLLASDQVAIAGPVLAELLQGARSRKDFDMLLALLSPLELVPETRQTASMAGKISFDLRRNGTIIPLVDILIGSVALHSEYQIYTLDKHFDSIPGLQLYAPTTSAKN